MDDLSLHYTRRVVEYSTQVIQIRKKINLISFLRLFVFVTGILLAIFTYRITPWLTAITAILFSSIFLILVRTFLKLSEHKNFLHNLITVNNEELMRLAGNIRDFDQGTEFLQSDHSNAADLDIFGHGSLFQIINRTSTNQGKIKLAGWLLSGTDENEIRSRQGATAELKEKTEWRHEFQAHGMNLQETGEELEEIKHWLEEKPDFINRSFYGYMIYLLPSITIVLLVLAFFIIPFNFFLFLVLIQFGITGINLRKINRQHRVMTKKYHLFSGYSRLFNLIEAEVFSSEKLLSLKNELFSENKRTSQKIRLFARLIDNFDRRLNMIVGVILNGLFLWDIHCVIRLEKWKNDHRKHLLRWLHVIAEYDALISFGGFWFNNPDYTVPVLKQGIFIFKSKQMSHPLLNKAEMIRNDLTIDEPGQVLLITGSNMAGKSTFLRSIGVNMILGMAGAPVCAEYLESGVLDCFITLFVEEIVGDGESYGSYIVILL